mgnify:CR=1 FL=1
MPADSSVFTTLRWENGRVAWLERHLHRLRSHAERLDIEWPSDFNNRLSSASVSGDGNLCRIRLSRSGQVAVNLSTSEYPSPPFTALSQAAPRFDQRAQGTKHAAWSEYQQARKNANDGSADIALLVHDGAVVDGDRCTPILLDVDGVAFAPSPEGGGIDSVTLSVLKPAIENAGIPFRYARLTETLLGRAAEIIVVGTGVGVAWLSEIDGQSVGKGSPGPLYNTCKSAFELALEDAWTPLE